MWGHIWNFPFKTLCLWILPNLGPEKDKWHGGPQKAHLLGSFSYVPKPHRAKTHPNLEGKKENKVLSYKVTLPEQGKLEVRQAEIFRKFLEVFECSTCKMTLLLL